MQYFNTICSKLSLKCTHDIKRRNDVVPGTRPDRKSSPAWHPARYDVAGLAEVKITMIIEGYATPVIGNSISKVTSTSAMAPSTPRRKLQWSGENSTDSSQTISATAIAETMTSRTSRAEWKGFKLNEYFLLTVRAMPAYFLTGSRS